MLNFKTFLIEGGGNIVVKNVNSGKDQPDEVFSQPIDLTQHSRLNVQNDVRNFLHSVNNTHKNQFGSDLFGRNGESINTGTAFAGSTHHLFDSSISDKEHNQYKPSVGDIDTMYKEENKPTLEKILTPGSKHGVYTIVGTKKYGSQMSAIVRHDNGEHHQIDFEPAKYEGNEPSDWNKFSHSSNWEDVKKGIKGSQHKMLLGSLTAAHGNVGIIRNKAGDQDGFLENDTFSVDKGLRPRYQSIGTDENDKSIVKELQPKDATYTTNVPEIYEKLIGKPPSGDDLEKFGSFQGLTGLIKKHLSPEQRSRVFDKYTSRLYGQNSQLLDSDFKKDELVKETALNHLRKNFPEHFTDEKNTELQDSKELFYKTNLERKQAKAAKEAQTPQPTSEKPKPKSKSVPKDTSYGGRKI